MDAYYSGKCGVGTIDGDGDLFSLAVIAWNLSDGAGIDSTVFRWGVSHGQCIVDLEIFPILLHCLCPTIRLRKN